jgi:transmembrane sensor
MKIFTKLITKLFRKGPAGNAARLPGREREKELWDSFNNDLNKDERFWNETWSAIQRQRKRKTVIIRLKQAAATAAVVAGLLFGVYYWFGAGKPVHHTPGETAQLAYKMISNTGADAMDIVLEDSSLITLFPASVLRYDPAFTGGGRSIYLDGTALFKVARDPDRPFTVYANNIATQVLGTTFKVAAPQGGHKTTVYLYEGKVVVKLNEGYYLSPGDIFSYDMRSSRAVVKNNHEKAATADHSAAAVSNWYMFENQDLSQVFDQLSAIYNVSIHYNPADIDGLNFIGKIERTDSLVNILKDITQLNDLTLENKGKIYRIKKKR